MAYGWLAGALERAVALAHEYALEWSFALPGPVTSTAIRDAERVLATALPPSLRALYLAHDGFRLRQYDCWDGDDRTPVDDDRALDPWDGVGVHSLCELVDETLRMRREIGRDLDQPSVLDTMLAVVRSPGGYTIVDAAVVDADGEYAMFWAGDGYDPSDWRSCELAPSFAGWLNDFFVKIAVARRVPGIDQPMVESSWSAQYHRRRGDEAAARGNRNAAWDAYLLALRYLPYAPEAGGEILTAASRLDGLSAAEEFYLRLIERALRTWAPELQTPFGLRSHWGQLVPSQREAHAARMPVEPSCPPILATMVRECTSFTLFEAPRGSLAVHFEPSRMMRATFGAAASPPGELVAIAAVQVAPYDVRGLDHWLLIAPKYAEVWRARFDPHRYDVELGAFIFSEPTLVAPNLDTFLDARLATFLERAPDWL